MSDDFEVHPIGTGKMLSERVRDFAQQIKLGKDVWTPPEYGPINCEVDGETVGRVHHAGIELDATGELCLMIFTDATLAAHVQSTPGRKWQLSPLFYPRHAG